jgi:hypothetical protein
MPSVADPIVTANSNLDNYAQLLDPTGENLLINGFFETQDLTGWSGSNIAILNNAFEGESAGRILANPGELYQDVVVEPNTIYDLSFYTKWFVTPNNPIEVKILNSETNEVIVAQMMGTSTNWNLVELSFTTPLIINSIRVLIEKGNNPGWFIDNAVLLKVETLSTQEMTVSNDIIIYPNPGQDILYIKSIHDIKSLEFFDLSGRRVLDQEGLETDLIDTSSLKRGVYLVRITDHNLNTFNQKIILN